MVIMDYNYKIIDILQYSDKYRADHWQVFKKKTDKKVVSDEEFFARLSSFISIEKISELLIILYLEGQKGSSPNIYELNRLLRRTSLQYSATFKEVKKLELLGIVRLQQVAGSSRRKKQVCINREMVTLYGDEQFRRMMLDAWQTDAKRYIKMKLNWLSKAKGEFERRILMVKKGKRVKNG